MTAQVLDEIFHEGRRHLLAEDPLSTRGGLPTFVGISSAELRGYVAVWAVVYARLFLVSFRGISSEGDDLGVEQLFPGAEAPVFAHWFTGQLTLLGGRSHGEVPDALFEHETRLAVRQGRVAVIGTMTNALPAPAAFDPILLASIDLLEDAGAATVLALKAAGIRRVGDVVRMREADLIKASILDVDGVIAVRDTLASFGFVLGSSLSGWQAEP